MSTEYKLLLSFLDTIKYPQKHCTLNLLNKKADSLESA